MKQFLINLRNFKTRERITDNESIIMRKRYLELRCLYSGFFNAVNGK